MIHFNYILGGFIPSNSFFHNADPRIKLLFTLYGMIVLFFIHSWLSFLFIVITVFIMLGFSRIGYFAPLKAIKSIWLLILLAFLFQFMNSKGKVIFNFGIITITEEALRNAFTVVIRLSLIIWLSLLLTATTSSMRIADSTESLLKKLGLKKDYAHEISMIMSLAIRFIPIISLEADQIINAQKARGAKFEDRNPLKKIKAFFPVIIPLMVSSFKRADELALAMDVRYYNGFSGRTKYIKLTIKKSDYLLLIITLGVFTIALFFDKVIYFA